MSSSRADTERLPLAGKLPERDILIEVFDRVTLLSDELNDENGLLSVKLAAVEKKAAERHEEVRVMFQRALDEILNVRSRMDDLEAEFSKGSAQHTVQ